MASHLNWATDQTALKIAVAIALYRLNNPRPETSSSSESDAQRWKKKAKRRKLEILRLREELKLHEDGKWREACREITSCRCHFFDECNDSRSMDDHWIDEVLRNRFLRLVRWKERRKKFEDGSISRRNFAEFDQETDMEHLGSSIDFLVELVDGIYQRDNCRNESSFNAIFHQAVDFIIASLKNLLPREDTELLEVIVNGLLVRLAGRMCNTTECDESSIDGLNGPYLVQQLLQKLATIAFVGQSALLLISQKVLAAAESMISMDPFDDAFPAIHASIFLMIQLLEFLISNKVRNWTVDEGFDYRLFEESVRSILKARKGLELLESRNGLYIIYMERVIAQLVKTVGPLASQGKLDSGILSNLLG